MTRAEALALIDTERDAQHAKWAAPHAWGVGDCSSPLVAEPIKLTVLTEELGEVARALMDGDRDGLRRELTQLAAVCVAWLEIA